MDNNSNQTGKERTPAKKSIRRFTSNDPYFVDALRISVEAGKTSVSMLQRKLKINFGRAGSLIEEMCAKGYVEAGGGGENRKVLLTEKEFDDLYGEGYAKKERSKFKVGVVSLGCDKNRVDTERMLYRINSSGYSLTADASQADVIIVNTCAFINPAREESINTVLDMAAYKIKGRCRKLVVTGCLPQKHMEELKSELVEADCLLGTMQYGEIDFILDRVLRSERVCEKEKIYPEPEGRVLTTPKHYAYLKIAEGCDNFCTYCTIPKIRGKYRSADIGKLLNEAEELAAKGVRELVLVAQDVTAYGKDIYGEPRLAELVRRLSGVEGIEWIRLLYCYPERIDDELIEVLKHPKTVKYLDIPMQHASDAVLKRMGRASTGKKLSELIERLRKEIPGITLRSTFMVGFPGETQEDFEKLLKFLQENRIDNAGFFAYSYEEGTPSALLPEQIEERVKQERLKAAYELQKKISKEITASMVGERLRVITDSQEKSVGGKYRYRCRGERNAPGVDGVVYADSVRPLRTGEFYEVLITGNGEYDLTGEITDESA